MVASGIQSVNSVLLVVQSTGVPKAVLRPLAIKLQQIILYTYISNYEFMFFYNYPYSLHVI